MTEEEMNALNGVNPENNSKNLHFIKRAPGDTRPQGEFFAEYILSGPATASSLIDKFSTFSGEVSLGNIAGEVQRLMDEFRNGETKGIEGILIGQIVSLNAMFADFAQKAKYCTHLDRTETNMRLAFKAQNLCRATLETLANIKKPRQTVITNQANISNGPQQVNNTINQGSDADLNILETEQNILLKHDNTRGECMVGGAQGSTIGDDKTVAAVGKINRPPNNGRKSKSSKKC